MASNFALSAFALGVLTFETGGGGDSLAFAMFSNFFASSFALLIARVCWRGAAPPRVRS